MIAASLSIILGAALVGAMADGAAAASPVRTAQTSSVSEVYARYNDNEITALLVAGQGRAAREHPEIAKFLRPQSLSDIPESTFVRLTRALRNVDPQYHAGVTVTLLFGDHRAPSRSA